MGDTAKQLAATYGDTLADMAREARKEGLDTLAYLLDMARVEAEAQSGRSSHA